MTPRHKPHPAKSRVTDWLIDNRMRYCDSCGIGIGIKQLMKWKKIRTGMCPFCNRPLILREKYEYWRLPDNHIYSIKMLDGRITGMHGPIRQEKATGGNQGYFWYSADIEKIEWIRSQPHISLA